MGEQKKKSNSAKRYDKEFKEGAVRLVLEQKRTVPQVAAELGIAADTLRSWIRSHNPNSREVSTQLKAAQLEIKRLRKEVADQEETIEILKKAAAIFSKP